MSMISRAVFLALGVAVVVSPAVAQDQQLQNPPDGGAAVLMLEAEHVLPEMDISLDGRVDEASWGRAIPITDFTQQEPVEGGVPSQKTEVRVLFDEDALYISAILYDDPEGIVAYQMQRDAYLMTDDRFMWILDTFNDGRTGYFFEINPNGLMGDGLISGGGRGGGGGGGRGFGGGGTNKAWDGIWEARTFRRPDGWSAEIRIPFRTLNFNPDADRWGINFQRTIRRNNEEILWRGWRRTEGLNKPIYAGDLVGIREHVGRDDDQLHSISRGYGVELRASGIASWRNTPQAEAPAEPTTFPRDISLDIDYNITPSLRASASINTDFAEVESDERRVNLTRFPQRFRERLLVHAGADEQRRQPVVPLVAPRLVVDPVLPVALPRQLLADRPRRHPRRRILDRHLVFERVLVEARVAFDQAPVRARFAEGELGREVGGLDDQGVALPAAARIAVPQTDPGRRMAAAQVDGALVSLALPGVVADGDGVLALHDAAEPVQVGRAPRHAPVAQALILRAEVAVHAAGVVEGNDVEPARRRRSVLPAGAAAAADTAGLGAAQKHEAPLALHFVAALGLRREGWDSPVRRVDHERRARARGPRRRVDGVVRAGHVRPAVLPARVAPRVHHAGLVSLGPLGGREELAIPELGGPFEGRGVDMEPDALQVRMPPRGPVRSLPLHRHGGELQQHRDGCDGRCHTERLEQSSPHLHTS